MRTSFALIGGLGLMLAACGQAPQAGHGMSSGAMAPAASGIPTPGTGTISPIEGMNSVPPSRNNRGVPTAGTGTISPIQGMNSVPPSRNTPGTPSAGTGTIAPVQGQDDAGLAEGSSTRP